MIFDTHFHLALDEDLEGIVSRAAATGVGWMLVAGGAPEETDAMLDRISGFSNVYAAIGVHPHVAGEFTGDVDFFRQRMTHPKVRAIGEVGLDYFYDTAPIDIQKIVFRRFLELAEENSCPAVIHCRDAYEDCHGILTEMFRGRQRFVMHCFTGSVEWAERFLELGGYISFTGIVTFPKSNDVRTTMKTVPLDRLMFETDSPYLAPVPHRGKKNEPAYVADIVAFAAAELEMDVDELIDITTRNAMRFFEIENAVQASLSETASGDGVKPHG